MDLELKDKIAFVAGSSRGIGRAIAGCFLQEGARVLISGREHAAVEATTREFQREFNPDSVMSFVGDLTDLATIRTCLGEVHDRWGAINAVVANIGSGKSPAGWQVDPAEWSRVFNLNFLGTVQLINEVMPGLIRQASGSIVLISSIAGVEATRAPLAYSSAKSALLSYGKNLSRMVADHGVRVNLIAPGNVSFPGGSWEQHLKSAPDQVKHYLEAEVPMARFGRPEEIADFAVFLCSPRAAFATGMCAVLDGGQTRTI